MGKPFRRQASIISGTSFMCDKGKIPGVVMGALIIISVAIDHFVVSKK